MTEETLDPIVPPDPDPGDEAAPTLSTVTGEPAGPEGHDGADGTRRSRRRRRWYVLGTVVVLLITTVVAAAFVRIPYYRFAPGNLYPTQALISVDGATAYRDGGDIDMTTVSSRRASVLDGALARFDPSVELVDQSLIDGDQKPEETQRHNQELMDDAKHVAAVVALRTLGYDIEVEGAGALVRSVGENTPASGVLEPDDTIVAIDGTKVTFAEEAIAAIGAKKPGDAVVLTVERPEEGTSDRTIVLAPRPDNDQVGYVGVSLGTRNLHYKLPIDVNIDSKNVTGPSGGLAFTLGVIDVLTPGSLTGGTRVAATGTIDLEGNVGAVGGVPQKIGAAKREGITLFLVPPDEYDQAVQAAGDDLKVVSVRTLDEALQALAANGGDAAAVEQLAAGPPGSFVPR